MEDIMLIVEYFEEAGLLTKGIGQTIKNETNKQEEFIR